MATDGIYSFVVLLYADDLIEWMTGDSDGGVGGFGGDRADVGILGDDRDNLAYFLPASNTSAVLQLDSTSNIGMGGVWLFKVNMAEVRLPGMYIKRERNTGKKRGREGKYDICNKCHSLSW